MAAATATLEKWIGFDMDECMAQLGVLYYFLSGLPTHSPEILKETTELLAEKEKTGEIWILRPAFRELLPMLGTAYKSGALKGVILYSNNGSQTMVEFVGDLMEAHAGEKMVVARLSASWPEERKGATLSKNLEFLQKHVSSSISHENLLFFDDLPDHELSRQLVKGHYVQVAPYNNQMSVEFLKSLFSEYLELFPRYAKYDLVGRAQRAEERDVKEGKIFKPMEERSVRAEKIEFRDIFVRFLELPSTAGNTSNTRRTRRRSHRTARKFGAYSRKCRRLRPSRSRIL